MYVIPSVKNRDVLSNTSEGFRDFNRERDWCWSLRDGVYCGQDGG